MGLRKLLPRLISAVVLSTRCCPLPPSQVLPGSAQLASRLVTYPASPIFIPIPPDVLKSEEGFPPPPSIPHSSRCTYPRVKVAPIQSSFLPFPGFPSLTHSFPHSLSPPPPCEPIRATTVVPSQTRAVLDKVVTLHPFVWVHPAVVHIHPIIFTLAELKVRAKMVL
ncbi:hypothetical protein BZA77DRAFT_112768 [Pyronema omphalodes]|nr:hypothetical protein BZA77DRAFT_112768 [Pyronema omphalodes]